MKMLDSQADWYDGDAVAVPAGTRVTFVDNPDISETELVIDISKKAGAPWFWTVPHYWFTDFDDLPTWEKVVELLHEHGLKFSAEIDNYADHGMEITSVISLNFCPPNDGTAHSDEVYDKAKEDAAQAIDLMNDRWLALSPVHAFEEWMVYITAPPKVYPTDIEALLRDSLDTVEMLKDLVSDRIETALDGSDEREWMETYTFVENLIKELQEALDGK